MNLFGRKTEIRHGEGRLGRFTEYLYRDRDGSPLAARFSGWLDERQALRMLDHYRKNDRNRLRPAT